jgi:phosphatidylglycerol:prolipoprotein diacylglycerol transferase
MVLGRIGCFMTGCCYGVAVSQGNPLGVVFPPGAPVYGEYAVRSVAPGTPVFPSQLLSSFGNLLVFAALSLYFRHREKRGQVAALYLVLYAVHRFLVEFARGDHPVGELSIAQKISFGLFAGGVALFLWLRRSGEAPGIYDVAEGKPDKGRKAT